MSKCWYKMSWDENRWLILVIMMLTASPVKLVHAAVVGRTQGLPLNQVKQNFNIVSLKVSGGELSNLLQHYILFNDTIL